MQYLKLLSTYQDNVDLKQLMLETVVYPSEIYKKYMQYGEDSHGLMNHYAFLELESDVESKQAELIISLNLQTN